MGLSELVRFLQTHSLLLVQFALTGSCSMDGEIDWLSTSSSITDFTNHCHCCRKTWQVQSCVCNTMIQFSQKEKVVIVVAVPVGVGSCVQSPGLKREVGGESCPRLCV